MAGFVRWIKGFVRELRRRRVIRVAAVYAGTAFVILQLGEILVQPFNLPGWTLRLVTFLLILGFPLAVGLAWVYNITEEGVVREVGAGTAGEETAPQGSPFTSNGLIVGLLILVVGLLMYPRVFSSGESTSGQTTRSATAPDTIQSRQKASSEVEQSPRIAVLPFENIAPDSTSDHFARGMHEEVLNQLSKVSGLEVLSRTSVLQYAQSEQTVQEISEELGGISALVEGTVRRAGGRVRITTQLIRAPEDEHLWSKTYERKLSVEEIFDIQADIAGQIASALQTKLTAGERKRIAEAPTDNMAAYDAYLKGRGQLDRFYDTRNPAYIDRGIEHLRTAVRLDATFAQAHAALSNGYRMRASGQDGWRDSASAALKRARALAPDHPEVLFARAWRQAARDSLQAARNLYEQILQQEPSNVRAAGAMGSIAEESGDLVEAVRWRHRAAGLAPRDPARLGSVGFMLGSIGMVETGKAWYRRAIEIEPTRFVSHGELALVQAQSSPEAALEILQPFLDQHPHALVFSARFALLAGRPGQVRSHLKRVPKVARKFYLESAPSHFAQALIGWFGKMPLGLVEMRQGNRTRGRALLRRAADSLRARVDAEGTQDPEWAFAVHLAGALAALGEQEKALRALESGLDRGPPVVDLRPMLPASLSSPFFEDLQSNARFQKIQTEVEVRREQIREEVRQLGIDLYPPGAKSNRNQTERQSDA